MGHSKRFSLHTPTTQIQNKSDREGLVTDSLAKRKKNTIISQIGMIHYQLVCSVSDKWVWRRTVTLLSEDNRKRRWSERFGSTNWSNWSLQSCLMSSAPKCLGGRRRTYQWFPCCSAWKHEDWEKMVWVLKKLTWHSQLLKTQHDISTTPQPESLISAAINCGIWFILSVWKSVLVFELPLLLDSCFYSDSNC